MKVLGFDTETDGTDVDAANILEVGAVLFDVHEGTWTAERGLSKLVFEESYLPLNPKATKVNGITEDMLKKEGVSFKESVDALMEIAREAKFIVAFNESFDRQVLKAQLIRHRLHSYVTDLPHLCAMRHVEAHMDKSSWKLKHLAVDYGVTVDPSKLHRAMADVMLMGEMLTAAGATPESMNEFASLPTIVIATPTIPPWEDNHVDKNAAKDDGYRWETPTGVDKKYPKQWVKAIKKTEFNLAAQKRKFTIIEEF